jgi:hypothetical protein
MRIETCAIEAAGKSVRASSSASAIFFTINQSSTFSAFRMDSFVPAYWKYERLTA